jgi:hypothetical protein
MKRAVHRKALLALVVVVASTAAALWAAWSKNAQNPQMYDGGRGWRSSFGSDAELIALVATPLIVWLAHKAFFSRYKR